MNNLKIMNKNNNKQSFDSLKRKEIYAIFNGDTEFEEYDFKDGTSNINITMPYLSTDDLIDMCKYYGVDQRKFNDKLKHSRWEYMEALIEHFITNDNIDNLLNKLFSNESFYKILVGHKTDIMKTAYNDMVSIIIDKLNSILLASNHEIKRVVNSFHFQKIGSPVHITSPTIKNIDREYIKTLLNGALDDINENKYDSALTKSRTILEEVFTYVIEKKNQTPNEKGDIYKLYSQVKTLYKMHPNKDCDNRINNFLNGLEKILRSITEMRNNNSDAHGVGSRRTEIKAHHALLAVNSAATMAEFILSVSERNS